jgi:hypothetical protein
LAKFFSSFVSSLVMLIFKGLLTGNTDVLLHRNFPETP